MLIPLKKQAIDDLIPTIATGSQYAYYWANFSTLLKNLFISLVGILVFWIVGSIFGEVGNSLSLIFRVIAGLYWLWSPIYWASVRNAKYRRYNYIGFWRGRIVDAYLSEELIKEESAIDRLGRAIIVENRRRLFNVEIGDKSGFRAIVTTPRKKNHQVVKPGQAVEGLLLSNDPDFMRIGQITDIYVPRHKIWLGDYPYIRRDIFAQIRKELATTYGGRKR